MDEGEPSYGKEGVMKTNGDIQAYLLNMELTFEEPREGTWVVSPHRRRTNLVITLAGPVIVFRVKIMEIPRHNREELFRVLLELNASEMMHGAYGVEGDAVVILRRASAREFRLQRVCGHDG